MEIFDTQLFSQGIIPIGASDEKGRSWSDPSSRKSSLTGMADLCWKDEIDAIMDYYGIPKNRVIAISGKTGRYVPNKENQNSFLEHDILPVHIPLIEAHFKDIGNPFLPNYLFAKQQFDAARTYTTTAEQPEGTTIDPITKQFIDKGGNIVKPVIRPANYNPYGFNPTASQGDGWGNIASDEGKTNGELELRKEGGVNENINGHNDQVSTSGEMPGTGFKGDLPIQPPVIGEDISGDGLGQEQGPTSESEKTNGEILSNGEGQGGLKQVDGQTS